MDLFESEQRIYNKALEYVKNGNSNNPCSFEEYELLAKEYGMLLKHIRRVTRFADKTTVDLFYSNMDLTDKVFHDPLTGLYNRRFFEETIVQSIKDLSRTRALLSVMMLDVDYFKRYNDTYGHHAGDLCLQSIAETLLESITREHDFVARYGGEEFVIVLPFADEHGARIIANKVLETVMDRNIPHEKNDIAKCVTISIGITTIKVEHYHKSEDYIKCADKALYMSKKNGRNQYTYIQFEEGL